MQKEKLADKVFKEVCKISKGQVKTYKQLALKLKTGPRAIAKILSSNKNPIKIPCHRVICNNGKIGGYTFKGKFNPKLKIKLLKKEGIKINAKRIFHQNN